MYRPAPRPLMLCSPPAPAGATERRMGVLIALTRLLRARREGPRDRAAAKCGQQFPPSDGDCHMPSRARCVRIPRHERAVFAFGRAGCWLLTLSSASRSLGREAARHFSLIGWTFFSGSQSAPRSSRSHPAASAAASRTRTRRRVPWQGPRARDSRADGHR
jgi:hypothetical protein